MEWVKEALQGFKQGLKDGLSGSEEAPRSRVADWVLLVVLLAGALALLAYK